MMAAPHLIIVCGVPGAGKSTLARHAAERWGAVTFASETFAEQLGAAARGPDGDLTREAVAHAYAAMGAAVAASLAAHPLVVTVGSFRAADLRQLFRSLAVTAGAHSTTLRVACSAAVAAERVRARRASGERGPNQAAIQEIDAALARADDVDVIVANEGSIEHFYGQIDAVIEWSQTGPHDSMGSTIKSN